MFEELNERRKAVERNIAKGFGIDCADLDLEKALEDEFEKGRAKKTFAVGDTFTRHGITYKCTGISANTGRPTWSKVKDGEGSKQEQPEKKEDKKDEQPKQEQKKRSFLKPDGTPLDVSKETDDNLSYIRRIIKKNIEEYKDRLDKLSPGAKDSRQIFETYIEEHEEMLTEVQEEIKRRKKQAKQQSKKHAKEEKQKPDKKEDKKDEKKEVKTEQNNSKSKKDDKWFTSFVELFNKPENIKKIAATIPDIDMKKKMEVYKIGSGDSDAFSIIYINTSGVGMSRTFSFDGSGASGLYGWSPNKAVKSIYESNKERLKR